MRIIGLRGFHIQMMMIVFATSLLGQNAKPAILDIDQNSGTQGGQVSSIMTASMIGISGINKAPAKWSIRLNTKAPKKHYSQEIAAFKASKLEQKKASYNPQGDGPEILGALIEPVVKRNFEGNRMLNGTPPDDAMAISNGGLIVAANNDGVEYYTESGQALFSQFWEDFTSNQLSGAIFDPKIEYDSGADRFVMTVLHGSSSAASRVILFFSKTADPRDGWNSYVLTGNPLNAGNWFDYPSLAIGSNEIYLTGNLFNSQDQFDQAVIYQINKASGYSGANLNWQFWSGLTAVPFPAFTLVPAAYGQSGSYGPGFYFVSNRPGGSDQIRFWDLSDDLTGSPELKVFTIPTRAYEPAGEAQQRGTSDLLDNGDCRIQDAFFLNSILHFVYHTDIGEGWNGISYNRLTVTNGNLEDTRFGLQGSFDYCYPGLASYSTAISDKSAMIGFLRSSKSIFPEIRVVSINDDMEWSNSIQVKGGENFVDIVRGDERWGDYTAMSRRHNASEPTVWMSGSFGGDIISQSRRNTYKTQIAEIGGKLVATEDESNPIVKYKIFPNPVRDDFSLSFDLKERKDIIINLYDHLGRVVKHLFKDRLKTGQHTITFNRGMLNPGAYHVVIQSQGKVLKNETIIIHR